MRRKQKLFSNLFFRRTQMKWFKTIMMMTAIVAASSILFLGCEPNEVKSCDKKMDKTCCCAKTCDAAGKCQCTCATCAKAGGCKDCKCGCKACAMNKPCCCAKTCDASGKCSCTCAACTKAGGCKDCKCGCKCCTPKTDGKCCGMPAPGCCK